MNKQYKESSALLLNLCKYSDVELVQNNEWMNEWMNREKIECKTFAHCVNVSFCLSWISYLVRVNPAKAKEIETLNHVCFGSLSWSLICSLIRPIQWVHWIKFRSTFSTCLWETIWTHTYKYLPSKFNSKTWIWSRVF